VVELIPLLILLAAALASAWFVAHPAAVFVVSARNGKAQVRKGTVTDAFLGAVVEVCAEFGIAACEVRGVARGRRIALQFSTSLPESARQRLRNWWALSGWSAQPASRS
jgi:hypothetical protein